MPKAILAVGSVALDTIQTPAGRHENALGGSAVYFALSARLFAPVHLVGIVGGDFPDDFRKLLADLGINLEGLTVAPGRPTFRWSGLYEGRMNSARTLSVDLGAMEEFRPRLSGVQRDAEYAMLGNTSPEIQGAVLSQLTSPKLALLDSMNHWIAGSREGVLATARKAGVLCLNEEETLLLAGETNLPRAVDRLLGLGVGFVIVKKAEHGALLAGRDLWFQVPAYPTRRVTDPTGAGDAFAGGVLGAIADLGASRESLKTALVYGSVMGSFAVEEFGTRRLASLTRSDADARSKELLAMMRV